MTTVVEYERAIRDFAKLHDYDMSYQEELLAGSLEAFETFARAQGTSSFRRALTIEAHFVARVALMMAESCGDCIRVNLRMAVRAGVDRGLLERLIERPEDLQPLYRDLRGHALDVSRGEPIDAERTARLRAELGDDGFAELAVCLAGCRLFTTVKRSLGKGAPREVSRGDF